MYSKLTKVTTVDLKNRGSWCPSLGPRAKPTPCLCVCGGGGGGALAYLQPDYSYLILHSFLVGFGMLQYVICRKETPYGVFQFFHKQGKKAYTRTFFTSFDYLHAHGTVRYAGLSCCLLLNDVYCELLILFSIVTCTNHMGIWEAYVRHGSVCHYPKPHARYKACGYIIHLPI